MKWSDVQSHRKSRKTTLADFIFDQRPWLFLQTLRAPCSLHNGKCASAFQARWTPGSSPVERRCTRSPPPLPASCSSCRVHLEDPLPDGAHLDATVRAAFNRVHPSLFMVFRILIVLHALHGKVDEARVILAATRCRRKPSDARGDVLGNAAFRTYCTCGASIIVLTRCRLPAS